MNSCCIVKNVFSFSRMILYQSFCKSIIFISQIGFLISSTDVEATLKQLWNNVISTLKHRWNDVVQRWKLVVTMMCNIGSTLFQHQTMTFYQRCTTLIRSWNAVWVRSLLIEVFLAKSVAYETSVNSFRITTK